MMLLFGFAIFCITSIVFISGFFLGAVLASGKRSDDGEYNTYSDD